MSLTLDDVVQGRAIPSPNYSSRRGAKVRLLILHTTEGSRTNASLGNWFKQKSSGASSHVGIDATSVVRFVPEVYSAWTARSANPVSSNAELCGFAKWGKADWDKQAGMLEQAARWLAAASAYHGIPLVRVREAQTKTGTGVCMHVDITRGWKDGSHADCGDYFADHVLDTVIARARELAGAEPAPKAVARPEVQNAKTKTAPVRLPVLAMDGRESGWGYLAQECLNRAGARIVRDGKPGAGTRTAVLAQQKRYGIPQTGVVDGWTWATFVADAGNPVRRGSAPGHPGIEVLQNWLGFRADQLDRDFGAASVARLQAVQRFLGIADDGAAGNDVRTAIATR